MEQRRTEALPDGRALFRLSGEIDLAVAPDLVSEIEFVIDQISTDVVLDLSEVDFIDSSGLAMLLRLRKVTQDRGGSLLLTGRSESLDYLFRVTRIQDLFDVAPLEGGDDSPTPA
ncbi:MAG: STAS domain-containing protein [Nocardioidaceae bacterium]